MRRLLFALLLTGSLPIGLIGCGARYEASVAAADTTVSEGDWIGIHHAYFPVPLGALWVYEGSLDGRPLREEVRALDATESIDGVQCVALAQDRYVDGELVEKNLEWFAQDKHGNVWTFGELTMEASGGEFVLNADSWQAGVDGAQAALFLPAVPLAGERFERVWPGGSETVLVASTEAVAQVPLGTFEGCLQVAENPDDEDADIILYSRVVGRVAQSDSSGSSAIVLYRRPR